MTFVDLCKTFKRKHKSDISSNGANVKQSANDRIEASIAKFLDNNRMTIVNLVFSFYNYPNMILLEFTVICPTTAEVEGGFSLMNFLYTPLRSKMNSTTLEHLPTICLAAELTSTQ